MGYLVLFIILLSVGMYARDAWNIPVQTYQLVLGIGFGTLVTRFIKE